MKITKATEVKVKGIIGIRMSGLRIIAKISEPARKIANSNRNHVEMKNAMEKSARILLYVLELNALIRKAAEMIAEQTDINPMTTSNDIIIYSAFKTVIDVDLSIKYP